MCWVNNTHTRWKNNPQKIYFENRHYRQKENTYTQFEFIVHIKSKTKPQLCGARTLQNFTCP